MRKYTHIEPRTEVSDAALASGDLNAWKQILGLMPDPRDPTIPPDTEVNKPAPDNFEDDDDLEDDLDDEDDED